MSLLYKKFFSGIRWNAAEAIVYQIALMVHQGILCKVMGPSEYGLTSLIFAFTFLAVDQLNLGLSNSFGPFYLTLMKSKKNFKMIVTTQTIIQLIIASILLAIIFFFNPLLPIPPIIFQTNLYLILSSIAILELLKKNLRTILQLNFLNKITATIELITVSGYFASVWIIWFLNLPFNHLTTLLPFLCYSLVNVIILSIITYRIYRHLPATTHEQEPNFWQRFFKSRANNTAYSLTKMPFSGNFLTPFIAATCGLEQAGILTLTSYIAYCISHVIHRMFDLTSDALLAHLKQASYSALQTAFTTINRNLIQRLAIVLCITCFGSILIAPFTHNHYTPYQWYFFMAILNMKLLDLFLISYERFLIIEEQLHYLVAARLAVIAALFFILENFSYTMITIITTTIIGKIIIILFIGWLIHYRWHIIDKKS